VDIHTQVQIAGSVIVSNGRGAAVTEVSAAVRIAGRLEVTGGPDLDNLALDSGTVVGAGLAADLGGGINDTELHNSTVAGPVGVRGGGSIDDLTLSNVLLGAGLATDLGGGPNTTELLNCAVAGPVRVSGGSSFDDLTLSQVLLGAGLAADLGGGINTTELVNSLVPRSVRVAGGASFDKVHLTDVSVGRRLTALLGDGSNTLTNDHTGDAVVSTVGSTIQGALTYAGGSSLDKVRMGDERPVMLVGPVTIATGAEDDLVSLDDTVVLSTLLIDTGAGIDLVLVDQNNTLLNERTNVVGKATIRTGAGNDEVRFGDAGASELKVLFAVAPAVNGGPGNSDDLFRSNYAIKLVNQAPFPRPGFENVFP
jgi:hypothetical protein